MFDWNERVRMPDDLSEPDDDRRSGLNVDDAEDTIGSFDRLRESLRRRFSEADENQIIERVA